MSIKRPHIDLDPDYEDVSSQQTKRQRILEQDAKEATVAKIEAIIKSQFAVEIENKELEILQISEKLERSRHIIDRLRACIVASYYGNANQEKSGQYQRQSSSQAPMIHPAAKKNCGKMPRFAGQTAGPAQTNGAMSGDAGNNTARVHAEIQDDPPKQAGIETIGRMSLKQPSDSPSVAVATKNQNEAAADTRAGRFRMKKRIIVGNVSKNIPVDRRDENDQASHKWMVYVRGTKAEPRIDHFVAKVWFFLHPSYRPNDLVEVSQHPFHLTRRGWGEFPVRVQLHFKDSRNKRVDVIHNLKLDRTYTGLQTIGAETVVDVELERDIGELKKAKLVPMVTAVKQENETVKEEPDSEGTVEKQKNRLIYDKEKATQDQTMHEKSLRLNLLATIKTEPVDRGYETSAASVTCSPTVSAMTKDRLTDSRVPGNNNNNNKVNAQGKAVKSGTPSRQRNKVTPVVPSAESVLPLIKADGSVVLAISPGDKKQGPVPGSMRLVPALDTGQPGAMPVTQSIQFVLKGLGSLAAAQSVAGNKSVATAAASLVPVHTTQTVVKSSGSRPSTPKTAPKVTKSSTVCSPSGTLLLSGVGSITSPELTGSVRSATGVVKDPVAMVTQSLTATSSNTGNLHVKAGKASVASAIIGNQLSSPVKSSHVAMATPAGTLAPAPIVLQGFGSLSGLSAASGGSVSSGATTKLGPVLQTGLPSIASGSALLASKSSNQSGQPGLIFLKCTDNQGKTYLIPQQLYPSLPQEKAKGQNSVSQARTTVSVPSPSVLLSPQKGQTALKLPGHLQMVTKATAQVTSTKPSASPGVNIAASHMTAVTGLQSKVAGQPQLNAPIVFLKPDPAAGIPNQTTLQTVSSSQGPVSIVKKTEAVNSQTVRLVTPAQIQNANTLKKTVNQSGVRGQLKVTSQGLINVIKQNLNPGAVSTKPVNGDVAPASSSSKQPLIVIPQNKQISLLPGKQQTLPGKQLTANTSLLSGAVTGTLPLSVSTPSAESQGRENSVSIATSLGLANQNKSTTLPSKVIPPGLGVPHPHNQLVIVPVSSVASSVAMATSVAMVATVAGQNSLPSKCVSSTVCTSTLSSSVSSFESVLTSDSKTMYIVVQGEKSQVKIEGERSTADHVQKPSISLLNSELKGGGKDSSAHSSSASLSTLSSDRSSPVLPLETTNKMMLVNKDGHSGLPNVSKSSTSGLLPNPTSGFKPNPSMSLFKPYRGGPDKKIIITGPKKTKVKDTETKQTIRQLRPADHSSMLSLIQAAVTAHPVVSSTAATHLHPYCARKVEDWLKWNIGKRRASEWQRASSVRKYIIQHIKDTSFQGEQLWSTKQILTWCRLHAYSPHYLEKPLHPTGLDLQAEHSLRTDKHKKFKSVSCPDTLLNEDIESESSKIYQEDHSDDEVDIIAIEPAKVKVKVEELESQEGDLHVCERLPLSAGASFVQDVTRQLGLKFDSVEVEEGYHSNASEDLIYQAMQSFMGDIVRESFALKVNMGRYPDGLDIGDVYSAICSLQVTDFISNKYLGVVEDDNIPTAYR